MSAFYLKYRPQKIAELDLQNIREQLGDLLKAKELPHAFLFSGPKGLGKTSAARILAKAINCERRKKGEVEPCNKCVFCQTISQGTCLDLIEIDAASNRGIDDIRELREKIKLSPTHAKKKIYVIDEVHMLTMPAFNALLKTLEEPPDHAFFVLCTTEPEKLPGTIISRCQRFNFRLANEDEIVRSLKRIVKGEKLKISDKALALISQKSDASFRDAGKILQQLAFEGRNISFQRVSEFLETELFILSDFLSLLARKKTKQALLKLDQAVKNGVDLKIFAQGILENLRQALLAGLGVIERAKPDYDLDTDEIKELIVLFDQASRELKGAVVPQLPLELAVTEWGQEPKKSSQADNDWLKRKWEELLLKIKKDNHSIEALLKSTHPLGIRDGKITIEVFYEFHKNRLTEKANLALVEKRLAEVFERPLKIEYQLRKAE